MISLRAHESVMWLSLFWNGNKSSTKKCTWKLLINKSHRNAHFDRHSAENVMFQFVWMLLTEMNSTLFLERLINVSIEVFIHTNVSWISHTIMWWPVPIRMNGIRSPKKETYLRFFFGFSCSKLMVLKETRRLFRTKLPH